jgi:restriction system protein
MNDRPLMLDGLDGYQFEELIAKIMKKRGYEKIRVTSKSRDVGKDIIMEDKEEGALILVECKHQDFVGRAQLFKKLQGAIDHEEKKNPNKKVKGMIVTSGKFQKKQFNIIRK